MRVAAVQFAPVFADVEANTQTVIETILRLAEQDVDLAVFPEAFLSGYCFASREEATASALALDSKPLSDIAAACREAALFAIVGFTEADNDRIHNTAALFGPEGAVGSYRKTHLPVLGLDKFVEPGDALPVWDLGDHGYSESAKLGIAICFDNRFPEVPRTYMLAGADLLCIPTNWPQSAERNSDHVCLARAMENNMFVIAANRVGEERSFQFVGRSKIVDPSATVLASADHTEEAVLVADIDPTLARQKTIVKRAGEYELPLMESRRPDLYGDLKGR